MVQVNNKYLHEKVQILSSAFISLALVCACFYVYLCTMNGKSMFINIDVIFHNKINLQFPCTSALISHHDR